MTPRQLRRAAEHKARKDAYKAQRLAEANGAAPALEAAIALEPFAPATAPKQTGPRTPEGKARSSQNARTHGLCSTKPVTSLEDAAEYDALLTSLQDEHRPATPTESIIVTMMANAWWQLQRVRRQQYTLFSDDLDLEDRRSKLAHRYSTMHERSFHRNLRILRQLQKERLAQATPEPTHFVSQKPAAAAAPIRFVSQNPSTSASTAPLDPQITPSQHAPAFTALLQGIHPNAEGLLRA